MYSQLSIYPSVVSIVIFENKASYDAVAAASNSLGGDTWFSS